jgi:hypothetical protein
MLGFNCVLANVAYMQWREARENRADTQRLLMIYQTQADALRISAESAKRQADAMSASADLARNSLGATISAYQEEQRPRLGVAAIELVAPLAPRSTVTCCAALTERIRTSAS